MAKTTKKRTTLTKTEIRTKSWRTLLRVYYARRTSAATRKAIEREARRCGYDIENLSG